MNKLILSRNKNIGVSLFVDKVVFDFPLGKVVYVLENGFIKFIDKKYLVKDKYSLNRFILAIKDRFIYGIKGYYRELDLFGLGYNFGLYKLSNTLRFEGGYSHRVYLNLAKKVVVFTEKKRLMIFGISKKGVQDVISDLRSLKKLDVYKGKGIRLKNEIVVLKVGKKR